MNRHHSYNSNFNDELSDDETKQMIDNSIADTNISIDSYINADLFINSPRYNISNGRYSESNLPISNKNNLEDLSINVDEINSINTLDKYKKKCLVLGDSPVSDSSGHKLSNGIDLVGNNMIKISDRLNSVIHRFAKLFRSNYTTVNYNSSHKADLQNSPVGILPTPNK